MIDRRSVVAGLGALAFGGWPGRAAAGPLRLRLLTFNANVNNRDYARFDAYLADEDPDVVFLQEAGRHWLSGSRLADLPVRLAGPGRLVLASRFPAVPDDGDGRPAGRGGTARRLVLAPQGDEGRSLVVYNIHLSSPRVRNGLARQERDIAVLTESLLREDGQVPLVVAGDFNAAPTSPQIARLAGAVGLDFPGGSGLATPTRVGLGYGLPDWFGVPVDHVALRGSVRLLERRVGPDLGSDHRPVTADLELA